MKQWKKMLCVLLSAIMIFTTMSVGVSAVSLASPGHTDSHGNKCLSAEQRATLLLDMVDKILLEQNITISYDFGIASVNLDFRSIDLAMYTLHNFLNGSTYDTVAKLADLGDIENLNDTFIGACYRNQGSDINMIWNVICIAVTNQALIGKFIQGNLSLGFFDILVGDKLDFDIGGKVKDALYTNLINSYIDFCPPGVTADQMIQQVIDTYLVGGKDANQLDVEGYLPSMAGKTSITGYTLYQYIENLANAVMNDILVPFINGDLRRIIKEFSGYTFVDDNDMVGDDSGVTPFIKEHINFDYDFKGFTLGNTSQGIFGQINDIIDYVLSVVWIGDDFWVSGDNTHIISNLYNFALNLYETFADVILPEGTERKTLDEVKAMSAEELVCYVAQAFVEQYIDYIVIDKQCTSIEELGCYIGMHIAAEIIPVQNYMAKIKNGQATVGKDLLVQIFTDIGVYYLQAYTSITGLKQGASLESNMMAIIKWALANEPQGNLGGIFAKCNTSGSNPWTILDNTIFRMIPLSLLNGVSGSYDLVMNKIIGAALDLDVNTILSIFYKNGSSPMNKQALQFIIYIINTVLSVVIGTAPIPDGINTFELILNNTWLGIIATNAIAGIFNMGTGLIKSALQFVTPFIGVEDGVAWLHNPAPSSYPNKTIDELTQMTVNYNATLGIPDDVYSENLADWNQEVDYDAYTFLKYEEAVSSANSFINSYTVAIITYNAQVEAGYGDYVTDPRLTPEFNQQAINNQAYNLEYAFGRLQQREACTTQLDYIIEMVESNGYKSSNYISRVWNAYKKALNHAKAVSAIDIYDPEDEDEEYPIAKQSMINYARRELIHAMKLLENPTADYTNLDAAIRQAKAIDTSIYTEESVAVLNYFIAYAEKFEENILLLSEQDEVDSVTKKLLNAIQGLATLKVDSEITVDPSSDITVDRELGYIHGLPAYATIDSIKEMFSTTNGGEVKVTTADGSDNVGTGTVVELFVNGALEESFEIAIFGDLSGDGAIDESDLIVFNLYNAWALDNQDTFDTTVNFFAGELTGDGCVDESDIIIINMVNAWLGEINQADPYNFVNY